MGNQQVGKYYPFAGMPQVYVLLLFDQIERTLILTAHIDWHRYNLITILGFLFSFVTAC